MVFFSESPPSLLEFSRHFFQWVLLQVFNTENIIILELVMGKVIPTLANTTFITRTFGFALIPPPPFWKISITKPLFFFEGFPKGRNDFTHHQLKVYDVFSVKNLQ